MSADIRFSTAQLLKIIQSGEFLGKMVGNIGKKKKKNYSILLFLSQNLFCRNLQLKQFCL